MKLHELINPDFRLEMKVKISSQDIDLQETNVNEENKDKTLQAVKIKDLPLENVFAFSLDNEKARNYFLNKFQPNITKYCDFILFLYEENTAKIVFCELKSEGGSGYEIQWLNTTLFVEYLQRLLEVHFNIQQEIEKLYVLFKYISPNDKQGRNFFAPKSVRGKTNEFYIEKKKGGVAFGNTEYLSCYFRKPFNNYIHWHEILQY